MIRYSNKDIIEVSRLHQGTSAAFIGLNSKTGRYGIYKDNNCMLGIDNEDIREKLASDILKTLNIGCADIDLIYDEDLKQNACFSNYIIKDDEELVTPIPVNIEKKSEDKIENYLKGYLEGVKEFATDEDLMQSCRKNFYNYTYICCIIDSYDLKSDNLPLVHNKTNDKYYPSPWFDFGTAFKADSDKRSSFFIEMTTDEVMKSLFENHYEDIKDISHKVKEVLTPEKLNELFNSDYLTETFDINELNNMHNRISSQIAKSTILEKQFTNSSINRFKAFISNLKAKLGDIFNNKPKLIETNVKTLVNNDKQNNFTNELSKQTNDTILDVENKEKIYPPPEL